MAALQGLKRRLRSVRNTRQITKAMQLVAASKLRRAQEAAQASQAYSEAARELLARLGGGVEARQHPLYQVRPVRQSLLIVMAGDRGMAGAYNSNILKAMNRELIQTKSDQRVIAVGKRVAAHVAKASDLAEVAAYDIDKGAADSVIARPVLQEAIRLFVTGEVDVVKLITTHFRSAVKQEVVVRQLLPVQPPAPGLATVAELEPSPEELLEAATLRALEAELAQAVLEARASEEAARMLAMMNATDNAGELIDDLNLTYNYARQATITNELAEITAGAEAINQTGTGA